jgi:hypothetical protein
MLALCPGLAWAHLGSPDVFYDGMAGPYPVDVVIRMPGVVPGRAQISVRVSTAERVSVAVTPIAHQTSVKTIPPPEPALPVAGETNLFAGELWLMTTGGYGIDIRVTGSQGESAVEVPVNSVATHELPLPTWLGKALLVLAGILFCSGVAIIAAASSESILAPDVNPGRPQRIRYWRGALVSSAILLLALFLGKKWWDASDAAFRARLRSGGWPEVTAQIHAEGNQNVLDLGFFGNEQPPKSEPLEPDHGKLLHAYLVRLPSHDVFAHIHPQAADGLNSYAAVLPPLPDGDYEVLCDLTLARSGLSSTATNIVQLTNAALPRNPAGERQPDSDDSWLIDARAATEDTAGNVVCHLADGREMVWLRHPPLHPHEDANLRFEIRDAAGKPATLEPYMGMMSHAVVLRADGQVFAHLHPSGNYAMAAQKIFDKKMGRPVVTVDPDPVCGVGSGGAAAGKTMLALPYEFPAPGNYRLWVQIKTDGKVQTGVFDAQVLPASL